MLTAPTVLGGWLLVPYHGADTALVELTVGNVAVAAYLDWHDGTRVAKVRPAALGLVDGQGPVTVGVRVDGVTIETGRADI